MKNIVILISGGGSNMQAIVRAALRDNWAGKIGAKAGIETDGQDGAACNPQGGARVVAVISDRPEAKGLILARDLGVVTQVVDFKSFERRDAFDEALAAAIDRHDPAGHPALVVLAGFMRILTPGFVAYYAGRLVNIHPSLLPAFPGLKTHQRALDAHCKIAGATVHHVTTELDHGPILAQAIVPVLPGDTAITLAARVLTQEHLIYPRAIFDLLL